MAEPPQGGPRPAVGPAMNRGRARKSACHKPFRKPFAVFGCHLAVTAAKCGGGGWGSNPPRTPPQRPANGFEDRRRDQPPHNPRREEAIPAAGGRCPPPRTG